MTNSSILALKAHIKAKFTEAKFIKQEAKKLHEKMRYLKSTYPLDSQIDDTGVKFYKQVFKDTEDLFFGMHKEEVLTGKVARHFHLAYAFLRGTPYHKVEKTCYYPANLEVLAQIVFGFDSLGRDKKVLIKELYKWTGYSKPKRLNGVRNFSIKKSYNKYKNKAISFFTGQSSSTV